MSVYTTNDDELCCPRCGETNVHLDSVDVDCDTPAGTRVSPGVGQRIALRGWCEHCTGRFALLFVGWKGVTYLEAITDGELLDDPFVTREAS